MDHDVFIRRTVDVVRAADRRSIERSWLASLVTRDQRQRSVWPRLVFLSHLPEHEFTPSLVFRPNRCAICGEREEIEVVSTQELDEDAFWFRPINVSWAASAIEACAPETERSDEGRTVLTGIIDAIAALPTSAQLSQLDAAVLGKLASNKLERTILLEALGYCGALPAAGHPSYAEEFIAYDDVQSRQPAENYKKEWGYPIRFWTGADGVDRSALLLG